MSTDLDDPIADAVMSDCPYQRATVDRYRPIRGPVSRTLLRQAALLVVLASVLPIVATYPTSTRTLLSAPAVETFPKVLLVGALGGAVQLLAAAVLVCLVVVRSDVDTRRQADRLVTLEDLATTISLGTGGFAIAFSVGYLFLGHLEDALTVVTRGTTDPFAAVATATSVGIAVDTVALAALAGSLACWAASRWVAARERRALD
ncbi:hypothetical protein [Halomarina rubra]|uniref:DUF2975 domain-containing protein n=1 Tax=Halomarina rubra TaxID=2071873 RepID=A0ABD6ARY5_9EURY|nr:hypothetical protein [Halomarina rubra]